MNWYKTAQEHESYYSDTGGEEYDLFDAVDEHRTEIMGGWYSKDRESGSNMNWTVVPFPRLKKIWEDFVKYGVVHDESGLMKIRTQFLDNLARLQAATEIAGHTQMSMEDVAEQTGYPAVDDDTDFYFNYLETPHGTPVSDYGLKPLWDLASQLMSVGGDLSATLVLLDRMLNVIHCRGDIASLFVDGGSKSLDILFGRPCGLNNYDEKS